MSGQPTISKGFLSFILISLLTNHAAAWFIGLVPLVHQEGREFYSKEGETESILRGTCFTADTIRKIPFGVLGVLNEPKSAQAQMIAIYSSLDCSPEDKPVAIIRLLPHKSSVQIVDLRESMMSSDAVSFKVMNYDDPRLPAEVHNTYNGYIFIPSLPQDPSLAAYCFGRIAEPAWSASYISKNKMLAPQSEIVSEMMRIAGLTAYSAPLALDGNISPLRTQNPIDNINSEHIRIDPQVNDFFWTKKYQAPERAFCLTTGSPYDLQGPMVKLLSQISENDRDLSDTGASDKVIMGSPILDENLEHIDEVIRMLPKKKGSRRKPWYDRKAPKKTAADSGLRRRRDGPNTVQQDVEDLEEMFMEMQESQNGQARKDAREPPSEDVYSMIEEILAKPGKKLKTEKNSTRPKNARPESQPSTGAQSSLNIDINSNNENQLINPAPAEGIRNILGSQYKSSQSQPINPAPGGLQIPVPQYKSSNQNQPINPAPAGGLRIPVPQYRSSQDPFLFSGQSQRKTLIPNFPNFGNSIRANGGNPPQTTTDDRIEQEKEAELSGEDKE